MVMKKPPGAPALVVPHAGDVDRNNTALKSATNWANVVPHAGDVDRNKICLRSLRLQEIVVPHAGDVDRNFASCAVQRMGFPSSPTRGTWIEMRISTKMVP